MNVTKTVVETLFMLAMILVHEEMTAQTNQVHFEVWL